MPAFVSVETEAWWSSAIQFVSPPALPQLHQLQICRPSAFPMEHSAELTQRTGPLPLTLLVTNSPFEVFEILFLSEVFVLWEPWSARLQCLLQVLRNIASTRLQHLLAGNNTGPMDMDHPSSLATSLQAECFRFPSVPSFKGTALVVGLWMYCK